MKYQGIIVIGFVALSTLGVGLAVADSSTPGSTQVTAEPIDPGGDPSDEGSDELNDEEVSLAYVVTEAGPANGADDCLAQWQALTYAKNNWNLVVKGTLVYGVISPLVPFGIPFAVSLLGQRTSALMDARELMRLCCAVPGRNTQKSCSEATRTDYLKKRR